MSVIGEIRAVQKHAEENQVWAKRRLGIRGHRNGVHRTGHAGMFCFRMQLRENPTIDELLMRLSQ